MAKMPEEVGKVTGQKINEDGSITVTFSMSRKNLKVWAKVFELPKWEAAELCNPRKKRRGTMRRRRRARNERSN